MKILIAEPLAPAGVKLLREQPGWEVIVSNPKDYSQHLATAHALLVRSAVTVNASVLAKAPELRVIGRAGVGVEAFCLDLLAIADSGGPSHGKTRVAPARSDGVLDESGSITILDGASAAARMGDTVARSVVVLLDQAEYDEEVEQLIQTFLGYADDFHIHAPANGAKALPASIEAFLFGLSSQSRSGT